MNGINHNNNESVAGNVMKLTVGPEQAQFGVEKRLFSDVFEQQANFLN